MSEEQRTKPKSPTNETNDKELDQFMLNLIMGEYDTEKSLKAALIQRDKKLELGARIDESERWHRWDGRGYDNELDEAIDERIAALEQQLEDLEQSNE